MKKRGPAVTRGFAGSQGEPGRPGAQGPQAVPGLQGPQGVPGERGPQGAQGEQGPQGTPGSVVIPDVTVIPTVNRYFNTPETDLDLTVPVTIPANQFTGDEGQPITEFAGTGPGSFGTLYINGIVQPGGSYDIFPAGLSFPQQSGVIYAGTPLIVETVQLTAVLSS
ncbi:DUF4183 domain-containing protein [Paenibacillus humicola]|uniref:DUF4183 domain-containing protein n=1 Tax=Paenibacillus humicola TaxID=3110540 RepID=UPI00237BE305|nr:DUF4183 domain-containing protein [Paenibacillus humicola]